MPEKLQSFVDGYPNVPRTVLQAEQVRLLDAGIPVSLVMNALIASILVAFQRSTLNVVAVIAWSTLFGTTLFLRAAFSVAYHRTKEDAHSSAHWLTRFRIGSTTTGIAWGLASFLLFPVNNMPHQALLAFAIAGMTAGAAATLSVDIVSSLFFIIIALVPLIVKLLTEGEEIYVAMCFMATIYLITLTLSSRRSFISIKDNICLRFDAVKREKELQDSEEILRQHQERLEEIVDKRTHELQIEINNRKIAEEEIKQLAMFDSLTHLSNRRHLMERLQHALAFSMRHSRTGAVFFIDLDNFKSLNDTLGHNVGDLLLQQVAQRLTLCVRKSDTVARLGGDEFVVILEDLSNQTNEAATQAVTTSEHILSTLSQPYQLDIYECHITTSIGATLFDGHEQGAEELLKQADIAMYQAKKCGRNTLLFFDIEMQKTIDVRLALENDLKKASESRQFQLYYQIQVDSSHQPIGAEALIRWIHPERGIVSPLTFIPLAEETGLILNIGAWVLEAACAQLKLWERDARTQNLVLAVNVSAKQYHQASFATQVQTAIQRHAVKPTLLKLELTESLLLDDIDGTISTMNALKRIGVSLSLDDFGTGYSSLQYLKQLPLDQIKIDQSFVCDIINNSNGKTIVRTIIGMARSLNLDVIAEGVEKEDQRQFLLSNGCTHYQGDLFGEPVPIEQFEALLKRDCPY